VPGPDRPVEVFTEARPALRGRNATTLIFCSGRRSRGSISPPAGLRALDEPLRCRATRTRSLDLSRATLITMSISPAPDFTTSRVSNEFAFSSRRRAESRTTAIGLAASGEAGATRRDPARVETDRRELGLARFSTPFAHVGFRRFGLARVSIVFAMARPALCHSGRRTSRKDDRPHVLKPESDEAGRAQGRRGEGKRASTSSRRSVSTRAGSRRVSRLLPGSGVMKPIAVVAFRSAVATKIATSFRTREAVKSGAGRARFDGDQRRRAQVEGLRVRAASHRSGSRQRASPPDHSSESDFLRDSAALNDETTRSRRCGLSRPAGRHLEDLDRFEFGRRNRARTSSPDRVVGRRHGRKVGGVR